MVEWELPPSNQFAELATRYFHYYGLTYQQGKHILSQIAVKTTTEPSVPKSNTAGR
jgi:hypothetical protein